jgi:hypothetical protein
LGRSTGYSSGPSERDWHQYPPILWLSKSRSDRVTHRPRETMALWRSEQSIRKEVGVTHPMQALPRHSLVVLPIRNDLPRSRRGLGQSRANPRKHRRKQAQEGQRLGAKYMERAEFPERAKQAQTGDLGLEKLHSWVGTSTGYSRPPAPDSQLRSLPPATGLTRQRLGGTAANCNARLQLRA